MWAPCKTYMESSWTPQKSGVKMLVCEIYCNFCCECSIVVYFNLISSLWVYYLKVQCSHLEGSSHWKIYLTVNFKISRDQSQYVQTGPNTHGYQKKKTIMSCRVIIEPCHKRITFYTCQKFKLKTDPCNKRVTCLTYLTRVTKIL